MTAPRRLVLAAALLLAGCAADGETATPHGYVAGAEETSEAQSRLVVADGETGAVRVLDLISEEVVDAGQVRGIDGIRGDGRFAYLATGRSVHVVDSGTWMVDHGDHVHYYRAESRPVGALDGERAQSVHSDQSVTAVSFADGTVTLLDRGELDRGTIAEAGAVELDPYGTAVPYEEHVLTSSAGAVSVRTRTGDEVATIGERCPNRAVRP